MDSRHDQCVRSHTGFKIVLGLIIIAIQQVIEAEVELGAPRDLICDAEVEDRMTRRHNSWIITVKPIMIDRAHAKGPAPAVPGRQGQSRVRDKMRSAIHVDTMIAAFEKRICDLDQTTIER